MAGVKAEIFGNVAARKSIDQRDRMLKNIDMTEPHFGQEWNSQIRSSSSCGIDQYEKMMAQVAQSKRVNTANTNYGRAHNYNSLSQ
jgi:hypothetical protein